jgi:hypothetical protein
VGLKYLEYISRIKNTDETIRTRMESMNDKECTIVKLGECEQRTIYNKQDCPTIEIQWKLKGQFA